MGDTGAPRRLAYQPALDGLRAFAVLAVVLYHDRAIALPGGFLGVDIFFVLSGFLITGILLADHEARGSTVSADFWRRRIRRLMPAFLLMLLLVAAFAAFGPNTGRNTELRASGLSALFYVNNWQAIYWSDFTPTVMSHVWSLSVEEQWYLVWPLLLAGILLLVRGRRTLVTALVVVLTLASATWMYVLAHETIQSRAFFGTDTRAWELLAGAGLAVVLDGRVLSVTGRRRWLLEGLGCAALAYLAVAVGTFSDRDRGLYPGARLLVVAAVVAVIAASVNSSGVILRNGLRWRPLVAIGLISYGVYLYHVPLFSWLSPSVLGFGGFGLLAVRLPALLLLATLSYLLVEMPIRRGTSLPVPNVVLIPTAVVVIAALFVLATARTDHYDSEALALQHYRELATTTPNGSRRLLVSGDETAFQLGFQSRAPFDELGLRGMTAATIGCGIVGGRALINDVLRPRGKCRDWRTVYREAVDAFDPDITALMVGDAEVFDRSVGGKVLRVGSPELRARLVARLEQARRILTAGDRSMILLTVPCADPTPASAWAVIRRDPARIAWVNGVFRDYAHDHPRDVRLADLDTFLCPLGNPHARIGPYPLRANGVTLTPVGSRIVWRWLAPIARNAARPRR